MMLANGYASTLNEMEKLWRKRRTRVFLALAAIAPLLAAFAFRSLYVGAGIGAAAGSGAALLTLGVFTRLVLPLFAFMTAVDLFAGEATARTLKLALVRPITRGKVFASKSAALIVCLAALLAVLWLAAGIAGWAAGGDGLFGGLWTSAPAYAAALVPMAAIGLFAACVAQWFRSSTGALSALVLLYAAASALPLVAPGAAAWSLFSYTDWHMFWIGGAPPRQALQSLVILAGYSMMAYMGGLLAFDRKPL